MGMESRSPSGDREPVHEEREPVHYREVGPVSEAIEAALKGAEVSFEQPRPGAYLVKPPDSTNSRP